jgi:murein DD-endopeptidase MepM/ murein hydrolase activator NlpD
MADQRYATVAGQVNQVEAQIGALMSANYEGSGLLALSALLGTPSASALAERLAILDREARRRHQILTGYLDAQIAAKEADTAEAAAERAAAKVAALRAAHAQAIAAANAQRDAALAQYQQLQVESDQLAAQLLALAPTGSTPTTVSPPDGAYFLRPVQGWKTSDFGIRFDPYYRVWQLHAGVDLAAPEGTPIYAGPTVRWRGPTGTAETATTRASRTACTKGRTCRPATRTSR